MMTPGPDHPITVEPNTRRVIVRVGGRTVADSTRAIKLSEASYPPVQYIPRADVDMTQLVRTTHTTGCPFKGEAAYYSIKTEGANLSENAAWTYEAPYEAVADIKEYLAFYPNGIDSIEEIDD